MIQIKNLHVDLKDFRLQDINLTVSDGEYFIVLGPTGAGKTVLLESIAGLISEICSISWNLLLAVIFSDCSCCQVV